MIKKEKILANLIWRFAERCGAQGVSFVVSIVLARILAPEVYGIIALVTVFTNILNVFVDSGLGNALIQKKNAENGDFSTVFFFNIAMCSVLYLGIFACAPVIAGFYNDSTLIPVIRVLGLTLVISGVKNVQQAYVARTMQFKRFFYATLGGTIGAAVIGIVLAYLGAGVWALVVQQLFNAAMDTLILWITVKWRPIKYFSFQKLKGLFRFGYKLLLSSLLDNIYNELRSLIIGKVYSTGDLAYYNRGSQFPHFIVGNINSAIDSVLLSTMSKEQDDRERVKNMTRRGIKTSTYLMAPLMIGLAVCAEEVVTLVLTEKWLPCVMYLKIFCISYMFYPVHTTNLNAIKALGRSDLFFKLEIAKKIVGVLLLVITVPISVEAMAYSLLVSSFTSQIINTWPNKKLLDYSYLAQMKDILPNLLMAILMGMGISFVHIKGASILIQLIVKVIAGGTIYLAASLITKNDSLYYIFGAMSKMIKKL